MARPPPLGLSLLSVDRCPFALNEPNALKSQLRAMAEIGIVAAAAEEVVAGTLLTPTPNK